MRKKTKAEDCVCIECDEQAVAFWPVVDPDIPALPYCRGCLDHAKLTVITSLVKEGLFEEGF